MRWSTWIYLAIYVLYVAYHVGFVATPGPPLRMGAAATLELGEHAQAIVALDDVALVGVQRKGQVTFWLIDWTRAGELASGEATFADLRLGEMLWSEVSWPRHVTVTDGEVSMIFLGKPPKLVRYKPPAAPVITELPADVAWVKRDGTPVRHSQLRPLLKDDRVLSGKTMPGLGQRTRDAVLVMPRVRFDHKKDTATRDNSGFYLFDAEQVTLITAFKTPVVRGANAMFGAEGFFYNTHRGRTLEFIPCKPGDCKEQFRPEPYLGHHQPGIKLFTISVAHERLAICAGDEHLVLYQWSERGEVMWLADAQLDFRCSAPTIIDASRVLMRSGGQWRLISFEPDGGLLR